MKFFRILGIIFLVLGLSGYLFADYIADKVSEGKEQIASGQKKVNTIKGLSGLSPYTKDAGNMITNSGQKKIDSGKKDVAKYENVSRLLRLAGIGSLLVGIVLVGVSFIPTKNKR